jgi:hypothetical protein
MGDLIQYPSIRLMQHDLLQIIRPHAELLQDVVHGLLNTSNRNPKKRRTAHAQHMVPLFHTVD